MVFFSLALPLPSYAVRHVLDAKGPVAKLHMSRGGASEPARRRHASADDAAAAVAALERTEILRMEFRVAAAPPEGAERPKEARGRPAEKKEDAETSALEARAGARKAPPRRNARGSRRARDRDEPFRRRRDFRSDDGASLYVCSLLIASFVTDRSNASLVAGGVSTCLSRSSRGW